MSAFVKVVKADLQSGGKSIFKSGVPLGSEWELTLACGYKVGRRVNYKPLPPGKRHPHWHKRRNPDDALPPPRKVKHECRKG